MPYDQGISDWRLYSAEHSVGHDRPLASIEDCQALIDQATASDWFRAWFPQSPPIEVVLGGQEWPEQRSIYSFARAYRRGHAVRAETWEISLHPEMLSARVLLHELAHCVQPRYVAEDIKPYRGNPVAYHRRKHQTHGAFFAATLSVITNNMLPGDAGQLTQAYQHFETPMATEAELRAQLAAQPAILDEQEAWHDTITKDMAELQGQHHAAHGESVRCAYQQFPGVGICSIPGGCITAGSAVSCCHRSGLPRRFQRSPRALRQTSQLSNIPAKGPRIQRN